MIALEHEEGIAVATLCRPPVNAINEEWLAALNRVIDDVGRDAGIKVLWIRSRERVFCAGADLALMRERFASDAGRAEMVRMAGRNSRARASRSAALSSSSSGTRNPRSSMETPSCQARARLAERNGYTEHTRTRIEERTTWICAS